MNHDLFMLLPATDREPFVDSVRKKLVDALDNQKLLQAQLEELSNSILAYQKFLANHDEQSSHSSPPTVSGGQKAEMPKTQMQWILYIVEQPSKFGFTTCNVNNIVDAMLKTNPSFLNTGTREQWVVRISSVLSKTDQVVKMREKANKKTYHYLSKNWFNDNGAVKNEFKSSLSGLENIPL
jgi:transposase